MNEEELKVAIYTPPFEPKLIRLTNGETYEIAHPGSIAIGRPSCAVYVKGKLHIISNLHITQIEPFNGVPH
jgi:hypothetical protein